MDYTSGELTAVFIQILIAFVILRRSYAMTQGVTYSSLRLAIMPGLILVLWGVAEAESLQLTPWALPFLIIADSAILVATSVAFIPFAERVTQVSQAHDGTGTYRIGFGLAGLFAIAFIARITLAIVLFPSSLEFGSPPGGYPATGQQATLAAIDALFSFSAGTVLARSIGIRRKWVAAFRRGPPST